MWILGLEGLIVYMYDISYMANDKPPVWGTKI